MQSTRTEPRREATTTRERWLRIAAWRYSVAIIYLAVALPVGLLLCFLTPPVQSPDESRHFLRACQFAQGQILPQLDPAAHTAGGLLPAAAVQFVTNKMTPDFYRNEDHLHTIGARLQALDAAAQHQPPLSQKAFGVFPGAAIYPPALYLPQAAGIGLARFFSDKVYVWFYAARVFNAVTAVLLIFLALLVAPAYQFWLLIPAILPMSLYQISSVSSDAGFISISILFVALCLRFISKDGWPMRAGLIVCLLLLTLGKPVYLPFALLLLPAYKRLGWRRAITFCATAIAISLCAYLTWSYFVHPVFALAGNDFKGHNPSAQMHFILAHPIAFVIVLLRTLKWDVHQSLIEMIGTFGWSELPLPQWFYRITYAFFLAIILFVAVNWKRIDPSRFLWGAVTACGILLAIIVAGFVLWSPVGSAAVPWLQGRYFIPVLAVLPFLIPLLARLRTSWRVAFACLVLCFSALSIYTTVRIVKHYYFPQTKLLGENIHVQFRESSGQSCPASAAVVYTHGWFSSIARGQATVPGHFLVFIANEKGTILAASDPALAGADFPYNLLPGDSRSQWLVHLWTPDRFATLRYWLVTGKTACTFGRDLKYEPYPIPSA